MMKTDQRAMLGALIQYHRNRKYHNDNDPAYRQGSFIMDEHHRSICTKATLSKLENGYLCSMRLYRFFIAKLNFTYDEDQALEDRIQSVSEHLLADFTCFNTLHALACIDDILPALNHYKSDIIYQEYAFIFGMIANYLHQDHLKDTDIERLSVCLNYLPTSLKLLLIYLIHNYYILIVCDNEKAWKFYRDYKISQYLHEHILIDAVIINHLISRRELYHAYQLATSLLHKCDEQELDHPYALCYHLLSKIHMEAHPDKALTYLSLTLDYSHSHSFDPFLLSLIYRQKALIHLQRKEYPFAMTSFEKAIEIRSMSVLRNLPYIMYTLKQLYGTQVEERQRTFLNKAKAYRQQFSAYFIAFLDYYELKLNGSDERTLIKYINATFPALFYGFSRRDMIVHIIDKEMMSLCDKSGKYGCYLKFDELMSNNCTMY